ncbi:MAG: gfo/Idh/MocA family oxidoreductase, partial [Candidatus Poribacteria bacterium]
ILDDGTRKSVEALFDEGADETLKDRFFPHGITDGFALEKLDFFNAIEHGVTPETSGDEGLRDLAASFAILESAELNQLVKVDDVESGVITAYQKEINDYYGL